MIILLTGGSGCGKSVYAERILSSLPEEKRVYVATMQVYDEESVRRVRRHRAQRAGMGFETIECPKDLNGAEIADGSIVLLEDLVNLTANELFDGGDSQRIIPALENLAARCRHLVMVTNDVFSDGVCYNREIQEYMRVLAQVNRAAAEMADTVCEVVYAIPVVLKGEKPC